MNLLRIEIANPNKAIMAKAVFNEDCCAIKPMIGGPKKKPRKPILVTNVNAC